MQNTNKLDAVKMALKNEELRDWYATEHNLTADKFSTQNVNVYGTGGLGDIADQIISDAVNNGVLPGEILD